MAGEIDSLEIKISASAADASKNINKLADSLERLGSSNLLRISSQFENMAESFGNLSEACKNISNATQNLTTLSQALSSLSKFDGSNLDSITNFLRELQSVEINPEFVSAIKEIGIAVKSLSGARLNEKSADNLRYFIDTIRIITDEDIARMNAVAAAAESLSNANLAEMPAIQEMAEQMQEVGQAAAVAAEPIKEASHAFETLAKGAARGVGMSLKLLVSPLTAAAKGFSRLAEKAGQFLSSIKRIAMYRAVRAIIKGITKGFAEGRKNLYYYSKEVGTDFAPSMDRAATAALYFKNSIGAATAPLTNYLVPAIEKAVDSIVELINKFNELTAVLTGASTWTRAVRYPTQWQEALDDAEKSAKKLKSTMLGFDELNVIEKAINGSKSGKNKLDYSRMFEEVPTQAEFLENVPEYIAPIRLAWSAEGNNTLETIRDAWLEIRGLVQSVGESFRTVWENGTGQQTLERLLQIVQNIAGTFGAIAGGIRRAWDEGGRGTRIFQNVWNVVNNLLTVFRNIWGSIREWAQSLDWSPLLGAIETITAAFQRFTDPNGSPAQLLQYFFENVLEPLGRWTIEEGLPAAIDLFSGAIDGLRVAIEFLQPGLEFIMDALANIAGFTFSNISGLAEGFGSMLTIASGGEVSDESVQNLERSNDRLREFLDIGHDGTSVYNDLNDAIQDFGSNQLWGFLNPDDGTMARFGEGVYDWFHDYGQQIGENFYDSIYSGMEESEMTMASASLGDVSAGGGFFTDFFDNWNEGMDDFRATWESGWTSISDFFVGIWDGITGAVDGYVAAWNDGWNSIRTGAQEGWQATMDFLENGWNRITGFVTGYVDAWTDGWRTIKTTVSNTWTNIKTALSNGWNNLKNFVTGFKDHWAVGFNDIQNIVSEKWEHIRSNLSDGWETIKNKVSEYATKWSTALETIKRNVTIKFLEIRDTITNSAIWQAIERTVDRIRGAFSDAFQSVINSAGGFIASIQSAFNSVREVIRNPINRALESMEGLVNGAVDMIAGILQRLIDLSGPARDAFERVTGISLDLSWNIPYFSLPRFANGGFPDSGQLFLARESGAEMVGSIGGHTAVANNDQIVQAVSAGVYNAMMSAMQSANNGGRNEFHVYLSGREISAEVSDVSRNNGASILGGVVYAT